MVKLHCIALAIGLLSAAVTHATPIPAPVLAPLPASAPSPSLLDDGSFTSQDQTHTLAKRATAKVISGCTQPNTVALTFDDGPYQYTADLLKILDANKIKATFFMNGNNNGKIEDFKTVVRQAYNSNHQIASHTFTHQDLTTLSVSEMAAEMNNLDKAMLAIIGVRPVYMRPPYGNVNDEVLNFMGSKGYKVVKWNIDSNDWRHQPQTKASMDEYRKVLSASGAKSKGYIALQHDVYKSTALTLTPEVIKYIKGLGMKMVTVGECLGQPKSSWYRK